MVYILKRIDCLWGFIISLNQISWSLTQQHDRKLAAWHNRKKTRLSTIMSGNHLAVFLDYDSGSITFSEVGPSSTLLPLHKFSTTFAQPVCLGFGLYKPELNSRVTILKKIWLYSIHDSAFETFISPITTVLFKSTFAIFLFNWCSMFAASLSYHQPVITL